MGICVRCGKEDSSFLCDSCRSGINIEALCLQLIKYKPGCGENDLWDNILSSPNSEYNVENIVYDISDELISPRKEYIRVLSLAGDKNFVPRDSRRWLYNTYHHVKGSNELSCAELNYIRGLVLAGYVADYRYVKAEELATLLTSYEELPKQCYCIVGSYYTKTRRYEAAEAVLKEGLRIYQGDALAKQMIEELLKDNKDRQMPTESGKKEYMPIPKYAKEKYCEFLSDLDINVEVPQKTVPNVIPEEQYPDPVVTEDADFDSFVAFDIETTGLNSKVDSIIELAAIKVINGQLVEEKAFTFQELVRPYRRVVSSQIAQLTGITQDMVKDARQMWEVIPDFMEFVGDLTLVGYNSIRFDSKFLARAGRYSNVIITNKHFDVMWYVKKFTVQLGIGSRQISLSAISENLKIENPRAHRALADAITTAKVFLKLKGMDLCKDTSADNLLADLDKL